MKTSEVLRKAGLEMHQRGFAQGAGSTPSRDRRGAVCLRGAIGIASRGDPFSDEFVGNLGEITTGIHGCIVQWNDTPGRKAEEAQQALDAAYVLALQEEGIEPEDVL